MSETQDIEFGPRAPKWTGTPWAALVRYVAQAGRRGRTTFELQALLGARYPNAIRRAKRLLQSMGLRLKAERTVVGGNCSIYRIAHDAPGDTWENSLEARLSALDVLPDWLGGRLSTNRGGVK